MATFKNKSTPSPSPINSQDLTSVLWPVRRKPWIRVWPKEVLPPSWPRNEWNSDGETRLLNFLEFLAPNHAGTNESCERHGGLWKRVGDTNAWPRPELGYQCRNSPAPGSIKSRTAHWTAECKFSMVYSQAFVHSNSLKQFGFSKVSSNLQLGKTSTAHLAVSSTWWLYVYFLNRFESADTQGTQCGCHCLGCHGNRSSDAPCTCQVKWLPGAQPMDAAVVWRLRLRDEWIIVRNDKNV